MPKWVEACCRPHCRKVLEVEHEKHSQGVHPVGMKVTGGVVWWGQREPRVPQIMCDECVAEMEACGEFNRP